MANVRDRARPLSPHLSIWKWGPHMAVSIVHRATGTGMATVGTILFVWWLLALAQGPAAYGAFLDLFTLTNGKLNIAGYVFGIGLSWAFFQHMASGVRHLFMDLHIGLDKDSGRKSAVAVFAVSLPLTLLVALKLFGA